MTITDSPTVEDDGELESLYRSHKTTLDNSKKERLVSLCVLKFQGSPSDFQRRSKKELQVLLHDLVGSSSSSMGCTLMQVHRSASVKD